MTIQAFSSIIRQLASIAAIVLGAIPATALPNAVRVALIGPAGLLIALEHYVGDPSTGTTPAPTPTFKPPA
jgi:hypothetical protein